MKKRIQVGLLFGGKSAEHEISILSARNILEALDPARYHAVLIGIDKQGRWHRQDMQKFMSEAGYDYRIGASDSGLALIPGKTQDQIVPDGAGGDYIDQLDVIFPITHGPFGEDGALQGMLKLTGIPFVGASVLGSAVGMDKDVMKRLLRDAGIRIGNFMTFRKHEIDDIVFDAVREELGLPVYVKPANLGSSVGINRVGARGTDEGGYHAEESDFRAAVNEAFRFDQKIVIEENIVGREIEVAVLGDETPRASVAGEIIPGDGFYSYKSKYMDANEARLEMPAKISDDLLFRLQQVAIRTFQVLECSGLARVDFFVTQDETIYVNEINTLPGFTSISMYPKLWELSGIPREDLVDTLIQLALDRHERDAALKTTVE